MILMTARVIKGSNDTTQSFDGHGDLQPAGEPQAPLPEPVSRREPVVSDDRSMLRTQGGNAGEVVSVSTAQVAVAAGTETVLRVPDTATVFPGMQRPYIAVRKPKSNSEIVGSSDVTVEADQVNRL
jgi:hypothetical protein